MPSSDWNRLYLTPFLPEAVIAVRLGRNDIVLDEEASARALDVQVRSHVSTPRDLSQPAVTRSFHDDLEALVAASLEPVLCQGIIDSTYLP